MKEIPSWLSDVSKLREFGNNLEFFKDFYESMILGDCEERRSGPRHVLGEGLKTLRSFAVRAADVNEAEGFGILLNAMHRSMRDMGSNIGKLFGSAFKNNGVDNAASCPFKTMVQKFGALSEGGVIEIRRGEEDIKVDVDVKTTRTAFCGAELAKKFKGRPKDESTILTKNVDLTKAAFFNLLDVCKEINLAAQKRGIEGYSSESGVFSFDLVREKVQLPEVRQAIVGMHNMVSFYANMDSREFIPMLKELRLYAGEDKPRLSARGFIVKTPQDLAGIYHMLAFNLYVDRGKKVAEQISGASTMAEARAILCSEESVYCLRQIRQDVAKEGVHRGLYAEALGLLNKQVLLHAKNNKADELPSEVRGADIAWVR